MKVKYIITLLLFACLYVSNAQYVQNELIRSLQTELSDVVFSSVIDEAGNTYLTGFSQGSNNMNREQIGSFCNSTFVLSKIDPNEKSNWIKSGENFENENLFISEFGKVIELLDGNIVVAGMFNRNTSFNDSMIINSSGGNDIFLASYTKGGKINWVKTIGGLGHDFVSDLIVDNERKEIILTGLLGNVEGKHTRSGSLGTLAFLSKFDEKGNLIWNETRTSSRKIFSKAIAMLNNGKFIWALDYIYDVDGDTIASTGQTDCMIEVLNSNGMHLWSTKFGSLKDDQICDIAVDMNGSIWATGTFQEELKIENHIIKSKGMSDIFLIQIGDNGKVIEANRYGSIKNEQVDNIYLESNNKLLTGNFECFTIRTDSSLYAIDKDAFILSVDESNQIIGFVQLKGNGQEKISSINLMDKDACVWGYYTGNLQLDSIYSSSMGREDVFFFNIPITKLFNLSPFYEQEYLTGADFISVKPNPTKSFVDIVSSVDFFDELYIHALNGRIILQTNNGSFPYKFDFTGYEPGTYLIKAVQSGNAYYCKVIVN